MTKQSFTDRVRTKLQATGRTARSDIELNDAKIVESTSAVRVLATYSPIYGAPNIHEIKAWVSEGLGHFSGSVDAHSDTVQVYPESNLFTIILEQRKLRQPMSATANMVNAGVDQYLDSADNLWEVVKAADGSNYIVRRETTPIEDMLRARQGELSASASPRSRVRLSSMTSIPSVSGSFATASNGDVVDFYHNGQIMRGVLKSVGESGAKISTLSSGEVYTVDSAAITSIVERGAADIKEQDDVMRRYFSRVYPGNPEMTEIISPTSTESLKDTRDQPTPDGTPLLPISVVANVSARVSGSVKNTAKAKAKVPFVKASK